MNERIRRITVVLLVMYLAVFLRLNQVQVLQAQQLANAPGNTRVAVRDFSRPRGVIQTAEGVVLARSIEVPTGFKQLRQYPEGPRFGHVTGYYSFTFGTDGVERAYAAELAGRAGDVRLRRIGDLLSSEHQTANVTLTISKPVQDAAADGLRERKGAVVALDPRTGDVLALYSWPTFDPNPLSAHDQAQGRQAWEALEANREKPLLPRAYRERYAPGSTFKLVTSAAVLDQAPELATRVYPTLDRLDLPNTDSDLPNFGGRRCGGDMAQLLRVSCNTGFGQIGLDLGAERLSAQAHEAGFGSAPPFDLPRPARSLFPDADAFARDLPGLAKSAIGQEDVTASPLQMALVAAAVANGGVAMAPHVLAEIRNDRGDVIRRSVPKAWRTAMSPTAAATLRDMMVAVVARGSGTRSAIPGVAVAGKTGTAQTVGDNAHAWMVAFAPAEAPRVAVAVVVESQPGVVEATGGRVAAPIARAVIMAALARP